MTDEIEKIIICIGNLLFFKEDNLAMIIAVMQSIILYFRFTEK